MMNVFSLFAFAAAVPCALLEAQEEQPGTTAYKWPFLTFMKKSQSLWFKVQDIGFFLGYQGRVDYCNATFCVAQNNKIACAAYPLFSNKDIYTQIK